MLPTDITTEIVKTVIQIAVENLAKQVPVMTKELLQQAKMSSPKSRGLFSKKSDIVDRDLIRHTIELALQEENSTRVIYLYGPGGAGKTRLLEDAASQCKKIRHIRWAGIFDLYHTDLHDVLRLQSAIVENLDAEGLFFQKYLTSRKRFELKLSEKILEDSVEINELNQIFFDDYNEITSKMRVGIAFDTLENIGDEEDIIQRIFKLEGANLSAKQWLLEFSKAVKNTVILLAGRPSVDLRLSLEVLNQATSGRVDVEIGGLTPTGVNTLLNAYASKLPRENMKVVRKNAEQIAHAKNIMPVHLALLVDLSVQSPSVIITSDDQRDKSQMERKLVSAFFDKETDFPMFFLALTRKGLTSELLHYLKSFDLKSSGWSENECNKKLENIEQFALVKKRPDDPAVFLHDAIYELFDNNLSYLNNNGDFANWFRILSEYYQGLCRTDDNEWIKQKTFIVNDLYYGLRSNFTEAFNQTFIPWSEKAIKGYEIEFDKQLRNEVLSYLRGYSSLVELHSDEQIGNVFSQDSAIRWVKRLIRQSRYQQATKIAETLLFYSPSEYKFTTSESPTLPLSDSDQVNLKTLLSSAPDFFWIHLLACYGEGLTYVPNVDERLVNKVLVKVVEKLDSRNNEPTSWLHHVLIGRIYDRLGYIARVKGRYKEAASYYRKALPYFKRVNEEINIDDEYAFTQNNLAFVLALLGEMEEAKKAVAEALAKRQRLKQLYPLALSYNTQGLIKSLDNPDSLSGYGDCEHALAIFEKLDTPRGIGLACNALGYISRIQGNQSLSQSSKQEETQQWYKKAENFLKRAQEQFRDGEKIRLWEAYNELGSLYRDWGRSLRLCGDQIGVKDKFAESVNNHVAALQLAQENSMTFQAVDTLDDLVQVYMEQKDFHQAQDFLEQCKVLIPPEFDVKNANKPSVGEIHWLSKAKIQVREGLLSVQSMQNAHAENPDILHGVRQALDSLAYFQLYSDHPKYLAGRVYYITETLRELGVPRKTIEDAYQLLRQEHTINLAKI